MKKLNQRGGLDVYLGIAFLFVLAFAVFAFNRVQNADEVVSNNDVATVTTPAQTSEESAEAATFQSDLYQDFAFDLPDGWTASEPADYNYGSDGFDVLIRDLTSSKITATNGSSTLVFDFATPIATGFPTYNCSEETDLHRLGDTSIHRFSSDTGIAFETGVSEGFDDWQAILDDPTSLTTDSTNFCTATGILGGFTSNVLVDDIKDTNGLASFAEGQKYVDAWLMDASGSGALSTDDLDDMDAIMSSIKLEGL